MKNKETEAEEFQMDKWINEQEEKLGILLMEALHVSMNTGDFYKIVDTIEEWIKDLNLPSQNCERCNTEMPFFKYHLFQGICFKCALELEKEMK